MRWPRTVAAIRSPARTGAVGVAGLGGVAADQHVAVRTAQRGGEHVEPAASECHAATTPPLGVVEDAARR